MLWGVPIGDRKANGFKVLCKIYFFKSRMSRVISLFIFSFLCLCVIACKAISRVQNLHKTSTVCVTKQVVQPAAPGQDWQEVLVVNVKSKISEMEILLCAEKRIILCESLWRLCSLTILVNKSDTSDHSHQWELWCFVEVVNKIGVEAMATNF